MTLLKIAQVGHPILRERAHELSREELASASVQRFIDNLVHTMHDANGAGLAATQVYEPLRICAIEVKDNPRYPYKPNVPLTILVNPEITAIGDRMFDNYEGCLSVPNLRGVVSRHAEIKIRYWDRLGNEIERMVRGLTAGTFQHECDHLDGMLFLDRVTDTRTLSTWADFDRFHKDAFVERARAIVAEYGS